MTKQVRDQAENEDACDAKIAGMDQSQMDADKHRFYRRPQRKPRMDEMSLVRSAPGVDPHFFRQPPDSKMARD